MGTAVPAGLPGLCPDCGERLDDLPAGHAHETIDPRWAALAAFAEPAPEQDEASTTDDDKT